MPELRSRLFADANVWRSSPPSCWCLTDGRPGMENQAVGLAEAMGLTPIVKRVLLKSPWRILSPHVTAFKRYAMSGRGDRLEPPWPNILIATGRPSILPALYVKGQSGSRTFVVQLQDPVSFRHRFDKIVVPAHDGLSGPNVIPMDGALHRVTPEKLVAEAPKWADAFAHIPRPRVSVLLGGSNSRFRLGPEEIHALAHDLRKLSEKGHGLLITGSRRTGVENLALLRALLDGCPALISDGTGHNPYFGMLAHADAFVVTCDSVNMISEAASTSKPVHIFMLPSAGKRPLRETDKFMKFIKSMEQTGRVRILRGQIEAWRYSPLREMERVAGLIAAAYLERTASPQQTMSGAV